MSMFTSRVKAEVDEVDCQHIAELGLVRDLTSGTAGTISRL